MDARYQRANSLSTHGCIPRAFPNRGVWNTPKSLTVPHCASSAINLYFGNGTDLRLHSHQPGPPGGRPRHGPRLPGAAAPRAGVPLDNIFRDVDVSGATGTQERRGWHRLNGRLAGGDILAVVAIDRIGRRWPDTIRSICDLRDRDVRIPSLAESEAQWTRYLETEQGSPEAFFGQVLTMFAAWVADQERAAMQRRCNWRS